MIKKIKLKSFKRQGSGNLAVGSFRVYNELDEVHETGSTVSKTTSNAELEFANAETTHVAYSTSYSVAELFSTTVTNGYLRFNSTAAENVAEVTLTFKTGFEPEFIRKVSFVPRLSSSLLNASFEIEFYDEKDVLIKSYSTAGLYDAATMINNTVIFLDTEDLAPNYITNSPQKITTTDVSRLTDIKSINFMTIKQLEPNGTTLRYAVSFDGRATWKVFRNNMWETLQSVTADDIHLMGMTKDEFEAINHDNWMLEHVDGGNIDVVASLTTSDKTMSPRIYSIKCEHTRITTRQTSLIRF